MFFYKYTKLTSDQITKKLAGTPVARCASQVSQAFTDKGARVVLDDGGELKYDFFCKSRLSLAENGGESVECPYLTLEMGEIVLLTHLIPGTQRGWNVVFDFRTHLVTAFEIWFSGYSDNREVQRQIHYGWADFFGGEPPKERHALTNRLEGKGFWWRDDMGSETLTFFPSVIYSTFVETNHPRGGITICAPSDYIRINDHLFIYSRVEAEFSGVFVLEVINLFRIEKIGIRLGFDDNDELDYAMYTARGRITGQAASFEAMNNYGTQLQYEEHMDVKPDKGWRPVYRPGKLHESMTKGQVEEAVARDCSIFRGGSIMAGSNNMELSERLVGLKFTVRLDDGPAFDYAVSDISHLRWSPAGEERWHDEVYQAFEPAEKLILFSHMLTGSADHRNFTIAADFSNGLVTCVDAHIGNWRTDWEVGHKARFGILETEGVTPPLVRRHGFTTELVGSSFTWTYGDSMSSVHVYSSPESYSWTIFMPDYAGGMTWSSPCFYVKLREDAYLFSWVEETCNGNQGIMVFNPRTMHDGGFFFGVSPSGLSLTSLGAVARTAGSFDIMPYFQIQP